MTCANRLEKPPLPFVALQLSVKNRHANWSMVQKVNVQLSFIRDHENTIERRERKKTQINWEYRCIIVCIVRKGYICGRGKNCFWNQVLSSNLKGHCRNWYTSRGTPKYKFTDPPAATAHVSLEHPSLQEMDQRSNFFVIFARTPRVAPETASLTASPKASHNEAAKWRQTV